MKKILIFLLSLMIILTSVSFGQEKYKDGIVTVLKQGMVGQEMPVLNFKESQAGALDKGQYCLKIKPEGNYAAFNPEAKLESSEGEKVLKNIEIFGDTIDFEIKYESNTASVISLSNVKLTVNREAPGGEYHVYLYNKKDMDHPIFDEFYFYISQNRLISPDAISENPEDIKNNYTQENQNLKEVKKEVKNEQQGNITIINLLKKLFNIM